jgi:hypothetical protein
VSTTVSNDRGLATSPPTRRLVAYGSKSVDRPLTVTVMSAADRAAHEAASYVRAPRNPS